MKVIDLDLLFRYLRDVAMANNFVEKSQTPSFVALAFRNGMEYRYINVRINSVNNASYWVKIS